MATTARSIDPAAQGYIRHRFVRALCASALVGVVFGILAIVVGTVGYAVSTGDATQIVAAPLGVLVALVFVFAPVFFLVSIVGALIDLLHRRLLALVLIGFWLFVLFFVATGLGLGVVVLSGAEIDSGDGTPYSRFYAVWVFAFGIVGLLIGYEALRHAWWQFTVAAEGFRAVRGWRPPPWRLLTTFRRQLGLPSFLSYVGRRRLTVTLLYFGVAVLNLGLVLLFTLPAIIGSAPELEGDPMLAIGPMLALLLLNLFGAGAILARLADTRATKLYQGVREWDARAPIVFLRAFDQDKARLRAVGADPFARWPAGVGRPRTLDEILLEHASPYGPVIAIGDPRDPTPPLGAARVFVPEQGNGWQDVVSGLAGASKAVVMCPNHGEGVQWELDLIAQAGGRLQTIFLASPELDRDATLSLFQRLVPGMPGITPKQTPIAAYRRDGEWNVLTAKRPSVESYTAALNTALQALLGMKGEALSAKRG